MRPNNLRRFPYNPKMNRGTCNFPNLDTNIYGGFCGWARFSASLLYFDALFCQALLIIFLLIYEKISMLTTVRLVMCYQVEEKSQLIIL